MLASYNNKVVPFFRSNQNLALSCLYLFCFFAGVCLFFAGMGAVYPVLMAVMINHLAQTNRSETSSEKLYKKTFFAPDARILVVDDTRMNLIVIQGLLKQTGIQIDTAASGREGLRLVEENPYHIIFLDIQMPEMSGVETLRHLYAAERNKSIPVIALTANTLPEARDEYLEAGFSDYLSKPVDADQLEQIILQYLPGPLVRETHPPESDAPASDEEMTEIPEIPDVPEIADLDVTMGIQACGTVETFQRVLREFCITANDRIQELEHYLHTENYDNYTIKVHALKSSARLAGAMKLSEMAAYLEKCGDQKDIQEIKQNAPKAMAQYRTLAEAIGAYVKEREPKNERPLITMDVLEDAIRTLYEFMEVFDFDSADSIMEMLEAYAFPDGYKEAMQKLKILMINVARDEVMDHLKTMEDLSPSGPTESDVIQIPDIDAESALKAFGNAEAEYINILKVFTIDETERIKQIEACMETDNIALYTIFTHSLKSSAAIIGAAELSGLAEKLEMAGKKGNVKYIHENHQELVIKTKRIIENLEVFLQQYHDRDRPTVEKEEGSKAFLLENLVAIDEALTDYDISTAEEAINRLGHKQWDESLSGLIAEIKQKIQTFDYEEAQQQVVELLNEERKEA